MHSHSRVPLLVGALAAASLATAVSTSAQNLADLDPDTRAALEDVRAATEKYRDPEAALADGYVRDPMNVCHLASDEDLPAQAGGMGVHFFRPDLLGITATEPRVDGTGTHTDFLKPSVLVYVPDETGALKLGAVENLVWEDAWRAAGNEGAPEFHGFQYWHRIDNPVTSHADEAHLFEPHYELHVWLYEENPAGLFAQFNPRVDCATHDGPTTLADGLARMQAAAHAGGSSQP